MQGAVRNCLEEAFLPIIPIPPLALHYGRNNATRTRDERSHRSISLSTLSVATSLKPGPGSSLLSGIQYRNGSTPTLPISNQTLRAGIPGFETVDCLIYWIFAEPTTTIARELLLEWISNERRRRIRTGQGWFIRLEPSSLFSPTFISGPASISAVLTRVVKQCVSRKQAHLIQIIEDIQALFDIPLSADKVNRHTALSKKAIIRTEGFYKHGSATVSTQSKCLGVREEADRAPQAILDQALQHANSQPLLGGQNMVTASDRLSLKKRNVSQISGHSYGNPCDDASVFATVDTFSHNSFNTTMSSAPAITQRPALFKFSTQSTFDNLSQTQSPVPKTPLPTGSLPSAPARSTFPAGEPSTKSSIVDPSNYGPTVNLNASRDTTIEYMHTQSSLLLESPPIFDLPESVTSNHGPQMFRPVDEATDGPPALQPLHSSPSLSGSLSTTSGALLSALSFVLPMFNQDCSVRYSVTPGQLEINLLKMIECERQKCTSSGILWGEEQSSSLSWMIENIRNLVSYVSCLSNKRASHYRL
jgi:hypothetical protein